jgi:hypothetical protein
MSPFNSPFFSAFTSVVCCAVFLVVAQRLNTVNLRLIYSLIWQKRYGRPLNMRHLAHHAGVRDEHAVARQLVPHVEFDEQTGIVYPKGRKPPPQAKPEVDPRPAARSGKEGQVGKPVISNTELLSKSSLRVF